MCIRDSTQLSCRLTQQQIKAKNYNKDVKKILKNLISSLSKISITSRIYFDSIGSSLILSTDDNRATQSIPNMNSNLNTPTTENGDDDDEEDLSVGNSPKTKTFIGSTNNNSKRNISTSTNETLTAARTRGSIMDIDNSFLFDTNKRFANVTTPRTSVPNETTDPSLNATPTTSTRNPRHTVSYTHLDVYKRQP